MNRYSGQPMVSMVNIWMATPTGFSKKNPPPLKVTGLRMVEQFREAAHEPGALLLVWNENFVALHVSGFAVVLQEQ